MTSETKSYLATLFGGKLETDWILIWAKQGDEPKNPKVSYWAQTVDEALAAIKSAESEPGWHVYAGVLPRSKSHGRTKRGGISDTSALLAFWVDIDIAGIGHKTTGKLPANIAEALALVAKMPLEPSLIVHSGGGIHAYWILKEVWQFDSETARNEAGNLMRAWLRMYQIHAATMGTVVDPTFDLARVLRIPGTTNWKGAEPRQCTILSESVARYDVSDLKSYIPAEAFTDAAPRAIAANQIGNLILDANANPPADKLEALRQAEPKFDLTIKYQRKDFPKNDFTPSSYDMSLAATAAYAGWTEQEIADLMIFVRRMHGQNLRIDDARYYVRTISIAISDAKRKQALDELGGETVRVIGKTASEDKRGFDNASEAPTPDKRQQILSYISQALGCRIRAVIKYMQDPPRYRLETGRSGIELGTVENLIGQEKIRNALAATDAHFIPKFKADDWEAIAQAFLDACAIVNTGPESTDKGSVTEWLNVYFDENQPGEISEYSIKNQAPHFDGESNICFYLSHFRIWVFQRQNEKMSAKQLGILLRRIGGEPAQVAHEEPASGKRTTRAVWKVPKDRRGRSKRSKLILPRKVAHGTNGDHPPVARPA